MISKRTGLLTAALAAVQATTAQRTRDNPCRSVALQQEESIDSMNIFLESDLLFAAMDAKDAYDCVTSVKLDASDAVAMIEVIRSYLDFQTTLVFNRDPPESYQQPAIDVWTRLDELSREVEDGAYNNQYEFDVALQAIFKGVHDGHFAFDMGVYGLFSWLLPDTLVSVSSDGQELPQVYALSDIQRDVQDASPIAEIEGEPIFEYLASYVNRTGVPGFLEPHAEFNRLTWNAAAELSAISSSYLFTISHAPNNFEWTRVYNGESISGRFANGSSFEWKYQAGSLMPLQLMEFTDPESISDQYVYLQYSFDGFKARSTDTDTKPAPKRKSTNLSPIPRNDRPLDKLEFGAAKLRQSETGSGNSGLNNVAINSKLPVPSYPENADIEQRNLGEGGFVSGYILDDISVGVLSIPSFLSGYGTVRDPGSAMSFSKAIEDFITAARNADVGKVIIDLSGNPGGTIFQGIDTFRQFFPDADPPLAVRGAATPNHNTLGRLMTIIVDEGEALFSGSSPVDFTGFEGFLAFVTSISTDTDGDKWDEYEDFFGPVEYNGGNFTNPARWDFASEEVASEMGQNITGYGDNDPGYNSPPWSGEDIVLLHDGSCGSTCAMFVDLMKNHASVRSVVAGGVPQTGPMQAVSGTRGGNVVPVGFLDSVITDIRSISNMRGFNDLLESEGLDEADVDALPDSIYEAPWAIRGSGLNLLDIVRPESDESPGVSYQFAYEAAHCRLFYTAPMMRDITELWRVVAAYANGDEDVCVPESTGGFGLRANEMFTDDPGFDGEEVWENANSTTVLDNGNAPENEAGDGSNNSGSDDDGDDGSAASSLSSSFAGLVIALSVAFMISM